eukprot:gene1733-2393_t
MAEPREKDFEQFTEKDNYTIYSNCLALGDDRTQLGSGSQPSPSSVASDIAAIVGSAVTSEHTRVHSLAKAESLTPKNLMAYPPRPASSTRAELKDYVFCFHDRVLIWLLLTAPLVLFLLFLTGLGFGHEVHRELNNHYWVAQALVSLVSLCLLLLYVCDGFQGFGGPYSNWIHSVLGLCALAVGVACLLGVDEYPTAPGILCMLLTTSVMLAVRTQLFSSKGGTIFGRIIWTRSPGVRVRLQDYLHSCSLGLLVNFLIVYATWMLWVLWLDNTWDAKKEDYGHRAECDDEDMAESGACLEAYLLWAWPALIGGMTGVFGLIMFYLSNSMQVDSRLKELRRLAKSKIKRVVKIRKSELESVVEERPGEEGKAEGEEPRTPPERAQDARLTDNGCDSSAFISDDEESDSDDGAEADDDAEADGSVEDGKDGGAGTQAGKGAKQARVPLAVRLLGTLLGTTVVALWVAASLAGADMRLTEVVVHFSLITFVLLAVLIIASTGWSELTNQMEHNTFAKKVKNSLHSDLAKAFLLLMACPLIIALAFISRINMMIRVSGMFRPVLRGPRGHKADTVISVPNGAYLGPAPLAPNDPNRKSKKTPKQLVRVLGGPLTPKVSVFLSELFVNPTGVLTKALWIGVVYFTLQIGVGKVVIVLLSWFNEVLAGMPAAAVIFVFFVVGISLFLLPPVPGVPVYLAGGIIVVGRFEEPLGYWGAIFLCTAMCFVIKLCACAIQQKGFGERMSCYVSVRKTVGINSVTIRAIRVVLQTKGLSVGKVSILCGGPDWPTSVLCGILRLDLFEMLLGTTPVLPIYLFWTVLAGAFQLKEGSYWEALANLLLIVSGATMGLTSVAAMYSIDRTLTERRKEIDAIPVDEEVLKEEVKDAEYEAAYAEAIRWQRVPCWLRATLAVGVMLMSGSNWMFALWDTDCFRAFNVTDSIDSDLGGD